MVIVLLMNCEIPEIKYGTFSLRVMGSDICPLDEANETSLK